MSDIKESLEGVGKFDLVMISMSSVSEWQRGVANRNRFVLKNLKKREEIGKVLVVDFLPFTLKRAARNWVQNILFGIRGKCIKDGLFDRCVRQEDGTYVYSTIQSLWNEAGVIKRINKLTAKLGFRNILLWSYQPMFVGYFGQLGEKVSVFDAVDNWYENVHYAPYKERLRANYRHVAQKANLVFTVAKDLASFFEDLGRKRQTYWVPNGIELEDFANPQPVRHYERLFAGIKRPIIGYIGTIQNRLDFGMIDALAKEHSDWNFFLAGPTWPVYLKRFRRTPQDLKMLRQNANVHFTGRVPYSAMPYVVSLFDVGLIPHRVDKFVQSMNPMKMYDYLALGKPIVSTPGAGLELFDDLIEIAHTKEEFSEKIAAALRDNSPEASARRIERVRAHTYAQRVGEMMEKINEQA